MSAAALHWAFSQFSLKPPERFLLVTLADRANQDGVCWPSRRDLHLRTGYSMRRVEQLLAALVTTGLVEKIERKGERGRQTSNLYVLHMHKGYSIQEVGRTAHRVATYHASLPRTEQDVGPAMDPPVDKPVEYDDEGGRNLRGGGEKISPLDVSEIATLESNTNQKPLADSLLNTKGDAVDNSKASPTTATSSVSAPDGAQEVRQGKRRVMLPEEYLAIRAKVEASRDAD